MHIPGWFNDDKHHFDLTVDTDPSVLPDSEDRTFTDAGAATGVQRGQTGDTTGDVTAADTGSDVTTTTQPMAPLVQECGGVAREQRLTGGSTKQRTGTDTHTLVINYSCV
ncbi:hypothetical protein JOB18_026600 [Solea senegalensis]|uniref:Uncharacterized protein n=1 Tax=Solea senegalensis TaxID=28829 RepID=A0AAV6SFZ0_SOLSE|nr:hypothetical protein JOB18_026600 [Solea senegalensis]